MTALALKGWGGFTTGLATPAAGEMARQVVRLTVDALTTLKRGEAAGSGFVFQDLQTLAAESGIDTRSSETFKLAELFLLAMPSHLPPPALALDNDGEVLFDWRGTRGELMTVALRGDGRLSYAARISEWDKEHGTKRFVDSIPQAVLDLVQQVARP